MSFPPPPGFPGAPRPHSGRPNQPRPSGYSSSAGSTPARPGPSGYPATPNAHPAQPTGSSLRLSDAERADAFAQLTFAYGEGRLNLDEYDRRCDAVTEATTRNDLVPLFRDLPAPQPAHAQNLPATVPGQMDVYSRHEIERARTNGKNTRLGLFGLGTVLSLGAGTVLTQATAVAWMVLPLVVIPTLFILLYIMKVGPESWYAPSPQQLERQRLKDMQAARRLEAEHRKALRAAQRDQFADDAWNFAQHTLNRFKK